VVVVDDAQTSIKVHVLERKVQDLLRENVEFNLTIWAKSLEIA